MCPFLKATGYGDVEHLYTLKLDRVVPLMTHGEGGMNILLKFQVPSFYGLDIRVFFRYFHKGWLSYSVTKQSVGQPRLHRAVKYSDDCQFYIPYSIFYIEIWNFMTVTVTVTVLCSVDTSVTDCDEPGFSHSPHQITAGTAQWLAGWLKIHLLTC